MTRTRTTMLTWMDRLLQYDASSGRCLPRLKHRQFIKFVTRDRKFMCDIQASTCRTGCCDVCCRCARVCVASLVCLASLGFPSLSSSCLCCSRASAFPRDSSCCRCPDWRYCRCCVHFRFVSSSSACCSCTPTRWCESPACPSPCTAPSQLPRSPCRCDPARVHCVFES